MRDPNHARAQELAGDAALLMQQGKRGEARELYRKAAEYEWKALAAVSQDKVRTRGIIAVSAAALTYKARQLSEVENSLYTLLSDRTLLAAHRVQLRELLEVVWDEQSLPSGTTYSGDEIWVSLRGGDVGFGTAPIELALTKSTEIKNLVYRTTELVRKEQFRRRGAPSPAVLDFVQARATQPAAGSYKFAIRLVEQEQLEMFPSEETSASAVSDTVFRIVKAVSHPGPTARQELLDLVPDADYRQALVKLVRSIVPGESGLAEVELTRIHRGDGESGEPERESVSLHKGVRQNIAEIIRQEKPPPQAVPDQAVEVSFHGVLRALHLDENWLMVVKDDGTTQQCVTQDDVLDDVVGPMVNRRVVVNGIWTTTAGKRKFLLQDIDVDADA